MAEAEKTPDTNDVLRALIKVLHDGQCGLVEIARHLKDKTARRFLLRESQIRAEYAAELENWLHHVGEHDVKEGGTVSGELHRAWDEVKTHLGGGDRSRLAGAEKVKTRSGRPTKRRLRKSCRAMCTNSCLLTNDTYSRRMAIFVTCAMQLHEDLFRVTAHESRPRS